MAGPVTTVPLSPEPDPHFSQVPPRDQLERTAAALRANQIDAVLVPDGTAARAEVLRRIPKGAEVFTATSRTLEALGLTTILDKSGEYRSVRAEMEKLDYRSQGRQRLRLSLGPEFVVGSVHAVTEAGEILVGSATGSQLAPYLAGAEHVLFVVGGQKVVPDLATGLDRLRRYSFPMEDRRLRAAIGMPSTLAKVGLFLREGRPGRTGLVLVPEVLGF